MAWSIAGTTTTFTNGVSRGGSNPITNWTITLPSGAANGDLLVLQLHVTGATLANPPVPVTPAGWTQLGLITTTNTVVPASGISNRHLYAYTQRTASTTLVVSFTGAGNATATGDSYVARVLAFRPGVGFTWDIDVIGTPSTNASANAIGPAAGITPTTLTGGASTLVVGSFAKANDIAVAGTVTTTNIPALVPAGFTNGISRLVETTSGFDAGIVHIYRLNAPQTATGNLTVADTGNAQVGSSILASFKEVAIAPVGGSRSFSVIC